MALAGSWPTSQHHSISTATRALLQDPSSCLPSVFRLEELRGLQLLSANYTQGSVTSMKQTTTWDFRCYNIPFQ